MEAKSGKICATGCLRAMDNRCMTILALRGEYNSLYMVLASIAVFESILAERNLNVKRLIRF